jgi:foldase protein PrsA
MKALAKAKDLRAKIVAGGDFAALAKAIDDIGSGANGGRGRVHARAHGSAILTAALHAESERVSEPVKTQFGYSRHPGDQTRHQEDGRREKRDRR